MIYDHLNSLFLTEEGVVNLITQFIEDEPGIYVEEPAYKRPKIQNEEECY